MRDSSLVPEAQVAGDSKIKRARGRRTSKLCMDRTGSQIKEFWDLRFASRD
jgi:hypothetical protein